MLINYNFQQLKILLYPLEKRKKKPTETVELNFTNPMETFFYFYPTELEETNWMPRLVS